VRSLKYAWKSGDALTEIVFVYVEGTNGRPYSFGEGGNTREFDVTGFYIATVPVTQAHWDCVTGGGSNPAANRGVDLPQENVSWDEITRPGGFMDRINASPIRAELAAQASRGGGEFRLPSEAQWEYAARGGPHWTDGYRFSGNNDVDAVAWYDRRHGDHTQPVALKAPNQLGIYDMSGNVWEWCQDVHTPDVSSIPASGMPYAGPGEQRVLRGGCFHNWAVHCTVSKRYEIEHDCHDGCIGFRLLFAASVE
jgi:formylglycine-generating enzyme required for sulfatase activity